MSFYLYIVRVTLKINELDLPLGVREAELVLRVLKRQRVMANIISVEDRGALERICRLLTTLIESTPTKQVKLQVISVTPADEAPP